MEFENIIFEKDNNIATIRLNRPKYFNALDFPLGNELVSALEICQDDEEIRAVVLTGEGKAFCSGGDLRLFKEHLDSNNPSEVVRKLVRVFNTIIHGIRSTPKPVIASINGALGGGGFTLAAACDIRIAASSAIFRQGYTSVSLVPDGAWTLMVPMLIGLGKATELVLIDPILSAKQAMEIGLVNQVVDDTDLKRVTQALAEKLANGPTKAFAISKDNLNNAMLGLLERQLELERSGMIKAAKTDDYKEGLTAFFEKREAHFTGR
ncbi:MAG: 1,2-epoxyphenylacetyl-CoA isomerase [Syntrophus sp. SKADARSKE-3]|nr:1,2-epoxyphenylacetyl-CoA isomerase [Syntrophus sp. SKADARSKE-3]